MSEREDVADDELSGSAVPGEEADADEFVVRALERAQSVARTHGYTRSTLPSWGLDETRPRRSLDGSSEYAAIETDGFGRLAEDDSVSARAAARAAAYRHANGIEAPASLTEEDPEGDLAALRQALEGTGASWSRAPGMAAMRPRYRRANSLGAILARTIKTREWDTPTKMGSIMAKWRDIVGPQVAEHARIETFEGHRLGQTAPAAPTHHRASYRRRGRVRRRRAGHHPRTRRPLVAQRTLRRARPRPPRRLRVTAPSTSASN